MLARNIFANGGCLMAFASRGSVLLVIFAGNVVQGLKHDLHSAPGWAVSNASVAGLSAHEGLAAGLGVPTPIPAAKARQQIAAARAGGQRQPTNGEKASGSQREYCGFGTRLMAECCYHLYTEHRQCGCWEKSIMFRAPFSLDVAVYEHNNYCLLGLSGQIDGNEQADNSWIKYIMMHDPLTSENVCGSHAVRGFAKATKRLVRLPQWPGIVHKLASSECSAGVGLLATSWGGTMAEILAGCANQGLLSELQGHNLPSFQVDRLITFGVPPTATTPIMNRDRSDGCFGGYRVFRASNSSYGATDMVAYSTRLNGFVHAQQNAVQLVELPDGSFVIKVHPCGKSGTPEEPDWATVSPYVSRKWDENNIDSFLPDLLDKTAKYHQMYQYIWCLYAVKDESTLKEAYIEKVAQEFKPRQKPTKRPVLRTYR
jgi:hypothetical protein